MESSIARLNKIYQVKSYEVDINAKITPTAVCNYFQEIAWEHAQLLNIGYDFLKSVNKFWVLSRLQVKFYNYPEWTDEIKLITWPKGIDGMFALRDFLIFSAEGKQLIAASSSWLILNADNHRPQKIDSPDHTEFKIDTSDAYIHAPSKIAPLSDPRHIADFNVRFTDIDVNKHVNNVKYIQWAFDVFSDKLIKGSQLNEMVVNFLAEASFGDKISLYMQEITELEYRVSMFKNGNNKELCRISFYF